MRKLYKIFIFFIFFSFLLFLLNFSLSRFNNQRELDINVSINRNTSIYFLDKKEIISFVKRHNPSGKVRNIDIHSLRRNIKNFPMVDSVVVYLDLRGTLNVHIEERIPQMRVMRADQVFYVDKKGEEFPLSKKYSYPCILVSAEIRNKDYSELSKLIEKIDEDKFYREFFIGITKAENDYILLTSEGNYAVELGSLENLDFKFRGFKSFFEKYMIYQNPLKYKKISLKYENQIVATLRKGFKSDSHVIKPKEPLET